MEEVKINKDTIELVKRWEGFRAETYKDAVGVYTIGYGTTARAGVGINPQPGMRISEKEAEEYLVRGLEKFAGIIRPLITAPVNENQFGAMLSLAYNIGPTAFYNSTLLRKFNLGDTDGAALEFARWNKAGGQVMRGLVYRREDEANLFRAPVAKPKRNLIGIILDLIARFFK